MANKYNFLSFKNLFNINMFTTPHCTPKYNEI